MKRITCREMGGPCDYIISTSTPEEMMKKGADHVGKEHPAIAEQMKNMSYEENKEWEHSFMKTWRMKPNM
ncbi:MAG: DUF1059 domain-containing protein [bacterium]